MSISIKELNKIKSLLKSGDFRRIAKELNVSQPWVSRVLADEDLANIHCSIISVALDIIEEDKKNTLALKNRIGEVTK